MCLHLLGMQVAGLFPDHAAPAMMLALRSQAPPMGYDMRDDYRLTCLGN